MKYLGGPDRPILGFGIALLTGLGLGAFVLIHLQNLIHYNSRVNHTLTVLDTLATSLALLVDAETGQRGYLLTGDPSYLEPYKLATLSEGSLTDYLQELRRLTSDNPTQQQYIARLEPLVEERLIFLERGINLRRDTGFEAGRNFVQTGQGKATMDEIRQVFASMRREENELLSQRSMLATTNLQRTRLSLIIGASISFALAAASFFLFAREVRARRRAEEELRYLNEELKTQVGEYVNALSSAKIALQHYGSRLLESEDDFRYMIELNPQVPWTADPEGNILDFNSRWLELTGLTREAALGTGWTQAPHPDDLPQMAAAWTASVGAGVPYDIEHRLRLADGSYRWMRSRAYPRRNTEGEVVRWYGSTEDIHEQKASQERVERQLVQLESLRTIDLAILGTTDLRLTLKTVLAEIHNSLKVDAAVVMLYNPQTLRLEVSDLFGFHSPGIANVSSRLGQGIMGTAALEQRMIEYPDLTLVAPSDFSSFLSEVEKIRAFYAVPLIARGKLVGVFGVGHRSPLEPTPEWRGFLEALAGQAAMAIDSATTLNDLQRSSLTLSLAYDTTIEGWSRALDLRDKETEGHSLRVTEMTLKLARAVGMSEDELVHLRRGALLHDIGKMGVPDAILLKPGKLTDEEWSVMHKHPTFAYELLAPIDFLRPALDVPYCHHEKWDGTGYPRQLKGEQIPLAARIFALVDVWDALRSDRPYRPGWSEEKVRDYIVDQSGAHFDPQIAPIFLDLLEG